MVSGTVRVCSFVWLGLLPQMKHAFEGSKQPPKTAGKCYLFRLSCLQSRILRPVYVNIVFLHTQRDGILFVFILGLEL